MDSLIGIQNIFLGDGSFYFSHINRIKSWIHSQSKGTVLTYPERSINKMETMAEVINN